MTHLLRRAAIVVAVASLMACHSEATGRPDAGGKVFQDARVYLDAPPGNGLTGLGQKCDPVSPICPSNASHCTFVTTNTGPSNYFCTPYCLENGSGTTNSGATGFSTISPQPSTAMCMSAFVGSVGNPTCTAILKTVPMDVPLQANKSYTGMNFGCLIQCGSGSACPTGMTCKMAGSMVCVPD